MADNVPGEASCSRQEECDTSESMVEINIKTLDSQSFKLRVNKDIPVMHLKEKVADVTGVPVDQQRLIYRGKVFKDDHLLSEYNFEDGCVLHLVVRHPHDEQRNSTSTTERSSGNDANTQGGSGNVIFGTLNIGGNGGRLSGDISQEVSEALRSDNGLMDILRTVGDSLRSFSGMLGPSEGSTNSAPPPVAANGQPDGTNSNAGRTNPRNVGPGFAIVNQIQVSQVPPLGMMSRQLVVPDSLATISEFINHLDQALQSYNSLQPNAQPGSNNVQRDLRGIPTPEFLGSVIERAQQFLSGSASSAFLHIARRLAEEASSTDPSVRIHIQSEATQVGVAMQNIGALLLELGRATMMLRMGQSPDESFVNAGPSVYINSMGPNPIVVQPSFQAVPVVGVSGIPIPNGAAGPFGSFDPTRNINVHVGASGSSVSSADLTNAPSDATNSEIPSATQASNNANTAVNSTATQALPPRAVLTAIPARAPVMSPGHVVSLILPVQVRTQTTTQGQSAASQGANPSTGAGPPPSGRVPAPQVSSGISSVPEFVSQIAAQVNSVLSGSMQGTNTVSSSLPPNSEVQNTMSGSRDVQSVSSMSINTSSTNDRSATGVGESPNQNSQQEGASPDSTPPLGLGVGGLQPKRRSKDLKPSGSSVVPRNPPSGNHNQQAVAAGQQFLQTLVSSGDGSRTTAGSSSSDERRTLGRETAGPDLGQMMSQVINTPAFSNLLTNVASQTGIGSPSDLRAMMEQCTQNPAVSNALGRIVQQTEGRDLGGVFGGSGRGQGGMDFSAMMEQMMPLVSQVFGSEGLSTPSDELFGSEGLSNENNGLGEPLDSMATSGSIIGQRNIQAGLTEVSESIEQGASAEDIFVAVLRSASEVYGPDDDITNLIEALNGDNDLANDYMNVLVRDVSGRTKTDSNA